MPDQDRLREYLRQRITNISTAAEDDIVALIAREVRLGRLEEVQLFNNHYWENDDTDSYVDAVIQTYIDERIEELSKEDAPNE